VVTAVVSVLAAVAVTTAVAVVVLQVQAAVLAGQDILGVLQVDPRVQL
jgi:hypothetical protein